MQKHPIKDRLRYHFDLWMAKGPMIQIVALFLASTLLILLVSALVSIARIQPADTQAPLSFGEAFWLSMMRALDPGTMGGDAGRAFRAAMLVVTLGGLLIVGTLIGILANGIEDLLENLRKGRSKVIEEGHTVILGWSPQVFSIIAELVIANENQNKAAIAILAQQDKVFMEDEIAARVGKTGKTRIICRTGSPIDLSDLAIVNPQYAKAIIVLSPDETNPDARVIKTILALTNAPNRKAGKYHIVAALRDAANLEVARLVGGDEAQLLLADDLIARIVAQTNRQTGLSSVYTELLNFSGDEIYIHADAGLKNLTFGEALSAYEDSTVIGLRRADGRIQLKPPMETRFEPGDQLIAISKDDDTIQRSRRTDLSINLAAIQDHSPSQAAPEHTLMLGWNRHAHRIIQELDHYVARASRLDVVSDVAQAQLEALAPELTNLRITFQAGATTNRRLLDELQINQYQHVILLSYSDQLDPQEADALTLVTLLHLRDIADRVGHSFSIVSEMLDIGNRQLAEVTRADDFIVSDRLISLMLSQIAENRHLKVIFDALFSPEGAELYLRPAGQYVKIGEPVNFYTVVEAARRRGEVAIGHKLENLSKAGCDQYGVCTNPQKSALIAYGELDRIIVLAEE